MLEYSVIISTNIWMTLVMILVVYTFNQLIYIMAIRFDFYVFFMKILLSVNDPQSRQSQDV